MIRDLVIIGCGGFGREVADVVDSVNQAKPTWNLVGFIDDAPSPGNIERVKRRGSKVVDELADLAQNSPPYFVVGIGDPIVRALIAAQAVRKGWEPAVLIHPTAAIGANFRIGKGSIVCAHAAIGSDVTIGMHVQLDRGVQVGHDSVLRDFVTAHPAAVMSGATIIEEGAELGTNGTVLPGLTIGANAVVGAAACVTRDIPPQTTVAGVPAKVLPA